jgi:N-acetyl-anhydromuramyl-L-alanine amidase AmpD
MGILGALGLVAGCSTPLEGADTAAPSLQPNADSLHESASTLEDEMQQAADEFDVPAPLLKAIAWENTRWQMVEATVEFEDKAPLVGIMGLPLDRVELAARLLDIHPDMVEIGRRTNIRAYAAVLDAAAADTFDRSDLGMWAETVAYVSDIELEDGQAHYIHEGVYRALQQGVATEIAVLAPQDVEPRYRTPSAERRGPDRSGVVWRPSPNTSSRPAGSAGTPSMVVIHTCEGSYSGCWSWLTNSRSGVSAHYVVNNDGSEVSQLVDEDRKAWHIGARYDCSLNGSTDCDQNGASSNNFTVGIEHAGYASQSSWSRGLLSASADLVCGITDDWGIPIDRYHIVGHGQLQPYNRVDPGANWPWTDYLAQVSAACGASSSSGGSSSSGSSSGGSSSGGSSSGGSSSGGSTSGGAIDIVIDSNTLANDSDSEMEVSSYWTGSNNVGGYYNTGYWWRSTAESSDLASFWFYLAAPERLTVQAWWSAASDRSREAPWLVYDSNGATLGRVYTDQSRDGGQWNALGTYDFTAGWNRVALSRWTTPGYVVIADAVRVTSAP